MSADQDLIWEDYEDALSFDLDQLFQVDEYTRKSSRVEVDVEVRGSTMILPQVSSKIREGDLIGNVIKVGCEKEIKGSFQEKQESKPRKQKKKKKQMNSLLSGPQELKKKITKQRQTNQQRQKRNQVQKESSIIQNQPQVQSDSTQKLRIVLNQIKQNPNVAQEKKRTPRKQQINQQRRKPLQSNHISKAILRAYMKTFTDHRDYFIDFLLDPKKEIENKPYLLEENFENFQIIRINCDMFSKNLLKEFLKYGKQDNNKFGMHIFLKQWINDQSERIEEKKKIVNRIQDELERDQKNRRKEKNCKQDL